MAKSKEKECAHCSLGHTMHKKPWYKEQLYIVTIVIAVVVALSYTIIQLEPLRNGLYIYGNMLWFPILIGLIISGFVSHFIPQEYVSKYLAGKSKRQILIAALLGFLMSACSHGMLLIAISLYRKGASVASLVTFLLASPWANIAVDIMLVTFFGIERALVIILTAMLIAVVGGFIFYYLEKRGITDKAKFVVKVPKKFNIRKDAKKRIIKWQKNHNLAADAKSVVHEMWMLSKMVLWWILVGFMMAAFMNGYVPADIFTNYFGPTILGLLATLLLATVIEVCSEGSAPIAFELYARTGAFGNSFTFLMAGVVTDYTEIGIIATNVGRRTALLIPLITVPQVLVFGYLMNMFL